MLHCGSVGSGDFSVKQVDVYRLDRQLDRSFETDGQTLYATMCRIAGARIESLANFALGEVSVMRVDLGRQGFAVLERI